MQWLGHAFDKLVADEVHVCDVVSDSRDATHRIAKITDSGAATFRVMRLRKPRCSDDVVDVVDAGDGIQRMVFGIALLDREIAGEVLIRILLKCFANCTDTRSDVGRMLPRAPCCPSAVVRRRILIV